MDVQESDNEAVDDKSSGLFSLPAALIKKLYTGSDTSIDHAVSEAEVDQDIDNEEMCEKTSEVYKSLISLINNTQELFQKNDAFESIKNMAGEATTVEDSNHVLISFVNVLNKVSKKYVVEKQELVYSLPLQILEKFKFSKKYQERSKRLENKCKAVHSISDLNACLQAIYE